MEVVGRVGAPVATMTRTIAELQAMSYRELQAECKLQGIPGKGKSDELLGKLIIKLQEEGKDVASPATTPQPVSKTSTRRRPSAPSTASPRRKTLDPSVMQRAVNTPVTATTPRRKSVDSSVLQRAMDTPLPPPTAAFKTPRTPPSAVQQPPAAAQPSRSTPSVITLFAIFVLMYAVGLNAPRAAKYIRQYDYGTGIGNLQIDVKQVYGAAAEWTLTTAVKGVESVKYYKAVADEQTRKLAREASLKIQEFQEKRRRASPPSAAPIDSAAAAAPPAPDVPKVFNGKLNTAVLKKVLRSDSGGAWEDLHLQLAEAWDGSKLAADVAKANVILFVCGSPAGCTAALDELSVAAPLNSTLVLGPGDINAGKGELQAQLARFLKGEPHGVVVLPAVDKVPLGVLSVLNGVMGEYGAVMRDGEEISSTGATFILTCQAPPGILAEESDSDLSMAVKKDLTLLLKGEEEDEAAWAIVNSFRRRIDLVAPVMEEELTEEGAEKEE